MIPPGGLAVPPGAACLQLVVTGLAGFNRTFSRHGSLSQLLSSYQLQAYQLSAESETRPEKSLTATSYGKQLTATNSLIALSDQSLHYCMA